MWEDVWQAGQQIISLMQYYCLSLQKKTLQFSNFMNNKFLLFENNEPRKQENHHSKYKTQSN